MCYLVLIILNKFKIFATNLQNTYNIVNKCLKPVPKNRLHVIADKFRFYFSFTSLAQ